MLKKFLCLSTLAVLSLVGVQANEAELSSPTQSAVVIQVKKTNEATAGALKCDGNEKNCTKNAEKPAQTKVSGCKGCGKRGRHLACSPVKGKKKQADVACGGHKKRKRHGHLLACGKCGGN